MNYLDIIKKEIEGALRDIGAEGINFSVQIPDTLEHGDATSNFCLVASKKIGRSPKEIFEEIEPLLTSPLKRRGILQDIEFKNPGFVNFFFKNKFISENIAHRENLKSQKYTGKKVLIEHTSVNLFKPFTIGHLMNNFTGEFIKRIVESFGGEVTAMSYPSDKSIGIAKAIWVIKHDGGLRQEIFQGDLQKQIKYLGDCYVRGVADYKVFEEEKNEEKIREVKTIANNIFDEIDGEDLRIFKYAKEKNLEYFQNILGKINSSFENFIFESEAGEVGKRIVLENLPKVFTESEGAVVYIPEEERKDINTSVFVNSEGNPTYAGKDIGLLDLKFKKFAPDISIYITDNEQIPHFKVVFAAAEKINKEWTEKSIHVPHGRMTFKGKKMSSRLGGVPSAEEVVEAVYEDVIERSKSSTSPNLSLQRRGTEQELMEIALSALRISILRSKPGVNIDFDPDKASSFEGDSGPYLCYTFARCCSLLQKSDLVPARNIGDETIVSNIERKVLQFGPVLQTTLQEIAPQKLVKYLFELSSEFNSFYATTKIIDEKDFEKTKENLFLTELVKETLQKGLFILGISAPEKM